METNTLKHTVSKIYLDNGNTYKVIATIKLHDECKNGTCSWSITGILQQKKGRGNIKSFSKVENVCRPSSMRLAWYTIISS